MRSRPDPTLLAALTGLFLLCARRDLVPWLRGPAPWPPEWQWEHAPLALQASAVPAVILATVAVLLLGWSSRPRAMYAGAVLVAALFPAALLAPVDAPVRELVRRTVHGSFTSYHKVATSRVADDPGLFMREHAAVLPSLRRGTPHAATHPPGPVLHYRAWLELAQRAPRLTGAAVGALRARGVDPAALNPPQTAVGLVAAALGAGTLLLLVAIVPLLAGALARELGADPLAAARLALLCALLPGLALMTPELDQALAVPVLLVALGVAWCTRASAAGPVLAGTAAGVSAFFSYGAPVLAVPAALAAFVVSRPPWRRVAAAVAVALAVFLVPLLVGHDPLASLRQGLALHREAFTAPRSYWSWLLWNPLDVAVFLGLPLVALLAREAVDGSRFARVLGGAVLLLLLSGSVRGEAGRILVPLLPVMLVAAAATWSRSAAGSAALGAMLAAIALGLRLSWSLP